MQSEFIEYILDKYDLKIFSFSIKRRCIRGLVIEVNKKNEGIGTLVMKELISFAKEKELDIRIFPTDIFGSDYERLVKWYKI